MHIVLDHRRDDDQQPMFEEMLAQLGDEDAPWREEERRAQQAWLKAQLRGAKPKDNAKASGSPSRLSELPGDAQLAFAKVSSLGYSGRHEAARTELEPLLTAYPDVYELNELACHIDTQEGLLDSEPCGKVEAFRNEASK
jgi:hypothetical protein